MADSRERRGRARLQPPVVSSVRKGSGDSYTESSERERQTGSDHIRVRLKKKKIHSVVFSSSPSMTSSLTSRNVLVYGDVNAARFSHEALLAFVQQSLMGTVVVQH